MKSKTLTRKHTKAEVAHWCNNCGEKIDAGEIHYRDPKTGRREHATTGGCAQALAESDRENNDKK